MSLRKKLAADGVKLANADAIEAGLCLNETERVLEYGNDLMKRRRATMYDPDPGVPLLHNPFYEKKDKKKK